MLDKNNEVFFGEYCRTCKYKNYAETDSPCAECIAEPVNLYSHKPVNWVGANGIFSGPPPRPDHAYQRAVKYIPENRKDKEKAIARQNIDAEYSGNKVQSLDSEVTEDQYPSATAVKAELSKKVSNEAVAQALQSKVDIPSGSCECGEFLAVKAVDENGKITEIETVDMPSGGDNSLGLTSAQVGQIAKITAVDDSGVPTAWEAVDFVSAGGGSNKFRLIADMTLTEQSDKVVITTDIDGNPFELSEVYCIVIAQSYEDVEGGCTFLPNNRWLARDAYVDSGYKTPKASEDWKQQMVFHAVAGDGLIVANQMARKSNNNIIDTKVAAGQTLITSIGIAGKMAVGSTIRLLGRDAKTEAAGEKWELIGSQTVQEEVQGITITAPAGKSYKSILIVDDMPQASANGSIDLKANGETIRICTNFMTSGTMVYTRKRAYLFSIVDTNVVGIISLGTQNQIGYGKNAEFGWKGYTKGPITTISYNAFPPGNVLLPVGTKISVWGK